MSGGSLGDLTEPRRYTFCKGWLEHKIHRPAGYGYQMVWALLEDNVIYVFKTDQPCQENQIGNLTIDNNATFTIRPSKTRSMGFKFDLRTGQRLNRFRVKKLSEREQWRGYITGISKGDIPKDLDLLDSEIKKMEGEMIAYHTGQPYNRMSIVSGDSGIKSMGPGVSTRSGDSRSTGSGHSSVSTSVSQGSPTVVHKFYNDHDRGQVPPSWFVPHCSREFAEKLLERARSLDYGNTLMRESTSFLSSGSYVISKIVIRTSTGKVDFDHYEVIRGVAGYKVNVENPHTPMKCLSEVMQWFVGISGPDTQPLKINDLKELGQDAPGYASRIASRSSVAEPWKWPPTDQGQHEPLPDYDEPEFPQPQGAVTSKIIRSPQQHNTVSQGILRDQTSAGQDRKSVGWTSVIKTPPPHHTYGGTRSQREPVPSLTEIQQRTREADELKKFDEILGGFETGFQNDANYVNTSLLKKEKPGYNLGQKISNQPVLPPPAPHITASPSGRHSYVNAEHVDADLAVLPVAPPAPRDPIVKSSTTQPPSLRSSKSFPSVQNASSTSTPSSNLIRHSSATSASPGSSVSLSSHISKSVSETRMKVPASPNSPSSFPTWDTQKPPVISPTRKSNTPIQNNQNETVNASPNNPNSTNSGIDHNDPGGVSTLRNRFERGVSMDMQNSPKTKQGADKRVQFQSTRQSTVSTPTAQSPTTDRLVSRRQTEPAIPAHHETLSADTDDNGRLDPSFKHKLENMLKGGTTTGVKTTKETRVLPQIPKQHIEDHEYHELPEIVPDAVTYVNERFNVPDNDDT